MTTFTLHKRFYISQKDINTIGLAPIRCRLTYNKNRKDFSTGITVKGYDGEDWIMMKRQKTQKELSIPLLPKAKKILRRYASENDQLLPVTSNTRFNGYLKEIADIVGIKKRLTHHVARRTFASTVLLYNNAPMEVLSELLGHSKMATTQQSYGNIVQRRVGDEMRRLKEVR